ncbi:hypothetical protein RJ639_003707 [Escallonia herrerae]|uniref:Protein CHUP1, chloroplastic n=1 Tax=Escallonia herrerae TaxID=1293975 RepID=A0AA89AZ18_9ASTE|nr:hypothetical protein RJ639_003707 [Escallonia herrerae]
MPIDGNESRVTFLEKEFEASRARIRSLEEENQELKLDVAHLKAQVTTLKSHAIERKSILWKKLQISMDSKVTEEAQQKPKFIVEIPEQTPAAKLYPKEELLKAATTKERPARVPKPPPPRPTPSSPNKVNSNTVQSAPPPPPPPPVPSKLLVGSKAVQRVPQLIEFYRSLMKRDAQRGRSSPTGVLPLTNSKNMIGEIENRSTHLFAVSTLTRSSYTYTIPKYTLLTALHFYGQIKSDVETKAGLVNFLTKEIEGASFTEIADAEAFVKWLDGELSSLVDERAVLKHFPQWPERKADALREAAFSYHDLKNLEYEASSHKNSLEQPLTQSLRRMQELERSVSTIERIREGTSKRYRELNIPWEWMLDTGVIGQIKLSSLALAKEYMERVATELQSNEPTQVEDLLLQGVRFAFRVHQFAGGFEAATMNAFEELRRVGTSYYKQ